MANSQMDKSLFFLTLSFACLWLVIDVAIGKNYVGAFLSALFPFMNDSTAGMSVEEVEDAKTNAPTSSAIGSNKSNVTKDTNEAGINSVPYGAMRQR